jgi:signal transduction histidine kinase
MASHQLRTPLTSVKGYLSMALEGDGGELKPEQRKLLQEAYSSSQRMVYMIADFLNVSRLKTGKFLLEISSVHLPKLIQEEVAQLGAAAKGRGLQLDVSLPSQFPALRLDENKIRQVIMNFIDNAVFYSKSGGTITISLHTEDDEVVFMVKDHGIGVPANEQQGVFTKFFRATNARHARPDGTGIGLFMAEKVIHAHGGEVIFKSEENKGSTFGFRLPLKTELKDQPNKLKQ